MDDNVLKRMTMIPSKPEDYILHNQGEDRWLCYLLLKQGWRVEFSAACDSFTACPLTFQEFYNQRRRWNPSTLFHNFNLIKATKELTSKNADISYAYIAYCTANFVGGIITPGSMILVLVGTFEMAFGITSAASFILNTVLVGVFIISCLTMDTDKQIMVAQLLSFVYAVMMVISFAAIIVNIIMEGPLTLPAIGFLATFGSFFLAAILHPQEFGSVFYCVIFMIALPSMFILLNIYSLLNMNIVSWGTREVTKPEGMEKESKDGENSWKGFFHSIKENFMSRNISSCFGFAAEEKTKIIQEINQISQKLNKLEKLFIGESKIDKEGASSCKDDSPAEGNQDTSSRKLREEDHLKQDELKEFKILSGAKILLLEGKEEKFWLEILDKYLKPLHENKEQKTKTKQELKAMRNNISVGIILINIIWISIIYVFEANSEALGMKWPLGPHGPNITFNTFDPEERNVVHLEYQYQLLEPVGLVFILFFMVMISIQLVGLLLHRVFTLGHIVASTNLIDQKDSLKDCVNVIKDFQQSLKPDQSNKTMEERTVEQIRSISDDTIRLGEQVDYN